MPKSAHERRRNAQASKCFNLHQKRAKASAKKMGLEKTAGKPLLGPFYYLYLKPAWVLKALPSAEGQTGHPDYWEALVDSIIAPHYKITDPRRIEAIKNIPYSQPRGRVDEYQPKGRRLEWIVQVGNDIQYDQKLQKQVLVAFNLGTQYMAGLVRFVPDYHEVMIAAEFKQFEELVAPMPEAEKKNINIPDQEAPGGIWDDDE